MDSFGLGYLLCFILLHCVHPSSALENVLQYLQGADNEGMRPSNPLKLIAEAKSRLGAAYDWSHGSDVVFDVQRSTMNHVLNPVNPIVYDMVIVNLGQVYDNKTGKFTCPKCGLYFFSFSSLPGRGLQTDVILIKDEVEESVIHSVLPANSSQLATKNVILDLHKGDQVWVKLASGNLWSRAGSLYFQGFLLTGKAK
ncbi:complement C1q tumor necrosis factor-related protein 6-like [Scyliorhinus torazame]|uniref:complement C1q tumor necrosis factor-related protein 6-like n=1 Tax=Scyliorhinus torazame TaxID=75743 RepID=UPI003B59BF79